MATAAPPRGDAILLHADLDGFYAQVEARRLGLDASVAAIGVLQWDSLIALSYPAKGCGVRRGMSSAEAQRLCPQITLAHVEVIFTSGEVVEDLVAYERRTGRRPRGECKASLSRYREASAEVFDALGRELPECVERASIDEAYVDASAAAEALRGRAKADGSAIDTIAGGGARDEWAIVGGAAGMGAADEPLLRGALVAERLRAVVREKTGFTMSVGVARSRPLAKLASSRHKPNRVSLVPAAAARELLSAVRLRDIGGLGGKLGEAVARAFGLSADATAAELWRHPRETLCERIGAARGKFVYDRIRGIGQDNVTPNLLVNSVSACKSFTATSARPALAKWIRTLAGEVRARLEAEANERGRAARTLALHFRFSGSAGAAGGERSRQCRLPPTRGTVSESALDAACEKLLDSALAAVAGAPLSRLALTAKDFEVLSGGGVGGAGALETLWKGKSAACTPAPRDGQPAEPEVGSDELALEAEAAEGDGALDVAASVSRDSRPSLSGDAGASASASGAPVAGALRPAPSASPDEFDLAGVDAAEQRLILKALEHDRERGASKRSLVDPSGRVSVGGASKRTRRKGGGRQVSVAAFFAPKRP